MSNNCVITSLLAAIGVSKLLSTFDPNYARTPTLSNGNLTGYPVDSVHEARSISVMQPGKKYYWEIHLDSMDNPNVAFGPIIGIVASGSTAWNNSSGESWGGCSNGTIYHNGTNSGLPPPQAYASTGMTYSVLLDLVAGTMTVYHDGSYWFKVTGIQLIPYVALVTAPSNIANKLTANFGSSAYTYPQLAV